MYAQRRQLQNGKLYAICLTQDVIVTALKITNLMRNLDGRNVKKAIKLRRNLQDVRGSTATPKSEIFHNQQNTPETCFYLITKTYNFHRITGTNV